MKYSNLVYSALFVVSVAAPLAANASQFQLPEEIGRIESARDMNLFQLEPSMLDERYYTSGRGERRQNVGLTLPVGAEIPDSDPAPVKSSVQAVPAKAVAPVVVPNASTARPASK